MNVFLIICLGIFLFCVISGMRKGMAKILYGMIAWVFVFWFVNFGTIYIQDYLIQNTQVSQNINQKIFDDLKNKYKESEKNEEGSGKEALLKLLPKLVTDKIEDTKETSINNFISCVADSFTDYAMKGISVLLAIVISGLIVGIVGKLLIAFELLPGISGINRGLGCVAGLIEAIMIIWLIMLIAEFFPSSTLGKIVIESTKVDPIIKILYDKNIIRVLIH